MLFALIGSLRALLPYRGATYPMQETFVLRSQQAVALAAFVAFVAHAIVLASPRLSRLHPPVDGNLIFGDITVVNSYHSPSRTNFIDLEDRLRILRGASLLCPDSRSTKCC